MNCVYGVWQPLERPFLSLSLSNGKGLREALPPKHLHKIPDDGRMRRDQLFGGHDSGLTATEQSLGLHHAEHPFFARRELSLVGTN